METIHSHELLLAIRQVDEEKPGKATTLWQLRAKEERNLDQRTAGNYHHHCTIRSSAGTQYPGLGLHRSLEFQQAEHNQQFNFNNLLYHI